MLACRNARTWGGFNEDEPMGTICSRGFRHCNICYTIPGFIGGIPPARMYAYVYKCQRKPDTYVYLAQRDDFQRLPSGLLAQLGELSFVLGVALTPERRLALADANVVRANLATQGFHIQFPPAAAAPGRIED